MSSSLQTSVIIFIHLKGFLLPAPTPDSFLHYSYNCVSMCFCIFCLLMNTYCCCIFGYLWLCSHTANILHVFVFILLIVFSQLYHSYFYFSGIRHMCPVNRYTGVLFVPHSLNLYSTTLLRLLVAWHNTKGNYVKLKFLVYWIVCCF